ncbi:AraC-type DNA-binding protein [Chitinophaga sp. CF118]|uniref:AraC family transcriptional regulator n=1 Tax=Chitinophaga sp. CF118 TaxID=1884367 RepID=UPI0008E49606|nr:AraC family transcriptional regulator [Chitinophaga sp. CF118]SFE26793.1 AraC-type DNA-binding protein [Chitinophaga sp. CF118]
MEHQQNRFILNMLAYAAQRDISPQQLCMHAGIDLTALKKDRPVAVSPKQLNDLWLNACHEGNDPLFGLHFGESLQLTALGVVGEIIKSSNTVGDAISQAAKLAYLITDLFHIEIEYKQKNFAIRFIPGTTDTSLFSFRQTMELFMVFVVHELDGLLLQKIKPLAVRLPYTISEPNEYERILRCRPMKKIGEYSIVFDNKYLEETLLTADYEMQRVLLEKVNSTISKEDTLQARIYNYLLVNAYLGVRSLEDIAANFNVSPRTLQRKLKDEGIKYQEVADEVKKSLALHYLESGEYPVKEVSWMLGYNELSAFTRAFKRWTGRTPVSFKKDN